MAMLMRRGISIAWLLLGMAMCLDAVLAQGGMRGEVGNSTTSLPPFIPLVRPPKGDDHLGRNITGVNMVALVVFIASIGGTGGGSVITPLLIMVMAFVPKRAIPLACITVVGATLANLILNVKRSRRNSNEPLIDWDLVLCLQPMLLMGANFGTFLGSVCGFAMLFILLGFLLFYVGRISLTRAFQEKQRERWGWWRGSEASTRLIGAGPGYSQSYTVERNAIIPWRKIGLFLALFAGFVGFSLLFGGSNFPSIIGISQNSFLGAMASFLPVVFLWCFSSYAFQNVVNTFQRQQDPHYILSADEIQWSPRNLQWLPFIALGVGTASGVFGFFGGIVNGPLFLKLGVEPTAAAAITAVTVLFNSAMASFGDMMVGGLDYGWAAILFPVGFFVTLFGQLVLERVMQRHSCPSLVIFSLAAIILLTAVTMLAMAFVHPSM